MTKDLVGPWVRRFLIEYVMVERNYSSNTQHSYRDMFRLFLPFAAKRSRCTTDQLPLAQIKPKLIREFTRNLEQVRRCGCSTINQRLTALRAWASFVGTNSPEHLEWSRQIKTVHLKKHVPGPATGEIEWMQTGRFRMGSSSVGFSSTDSLKILLPSSLF
jgi:site-specific recombinase XerD